MQTRNIAIIAHVDHGKTKLTDAILTQTGAVESGTTMDSDTLEQERGITIYSKNAGTTYKGTKINIVDTPGHADFGSEVERVLRSIDSVLLVVDAQEGPMPQTRFVLQKSLALGLKPILVINKIDKPAADPNRTHNQVFDLFAELGASEEQLDFPVMYAIAKDGIAKAQLEDDSKNINSLLDLILEKVPPASGDPKKPLRAQAFNLAYDDYLGRLAIVRVYDGALKAGDQVFVKKVGEQEPQKFKVTKLFTFSGITRQEVPAISAGDIAMIAGLEQVFIGDSILDDPKTEALPAISIDEPSIKLSFLVNDSPFAGREGKFVTGRQIRERLEKELEVNAGLKVDFNQEGGGERFTVYGRGELHIAILIENMRREGYELQVSQPQVITKEVDGVLQEPFEEVVIDVPEQSQGAVLEKLSTRGAQVTNMEVRANHALLTFEIPSRGLFGYRSKFIIDTKGEGIIASHQIGFKPFADKVKRKSVGSMVSQLTGKALTYALDNLQTRGSLYIGAGEEVYEGMVIGNTSKGEELTVNPTKGKHLTNMRASGSDDAVKLTPPQKITIESGLEIMLPDEYLEVTPESARLRKQVLNEQDRIRAARKSKK